ncbi:hypothetical protein BJ912DRAFT_887235 [Pholiota molesta]|nr:hypothetical protein BJ912DRAFT_887235 [Pholiota molesta]
MSMMSNASVVTKSGIIKDDRDTPMRRVRHRDGRLLRGGIGLTTGLGWSDSEDEDAPSPLTRRISTLNLSRRSSASSIVPGRTSSMQGARRPHPLARSASSGALLESERDRAFDAYEYEDDEYDEGVEKSSAWAQHQQHQRPRVPSKASALPPPTSWATRSVGSKASVSGASASASGARTSTSSVGSSFSLEVTTPAEDRAKTPSKLRMPGGSRARNSSGSSGEQYHYKKSTSTSTSTVRRAASKDELNTPSSTASTLSIPMPATPRDDDASLSASTTTPVSGIKKRSTWDKEKSLPPLPPGGLRKTPSTSHFEAATSTGGSVGVSMTARYAFPRARTFSSTSSAHSTPASHAPASSLGAPPTPPAVRPLQLPRARASIGGDRPAVPVPSVLTSATPRGSLGSLRSPSTPPSTPSSPVSGGAAHTGIARPKPRTGTGMVYRSSSSLNMKGRPMVLSASTGGSMGRTAGAARPIPL